MLATVAPIGQTIYKVASLISVDHFDNMELIRRGKEDKVKKAC